MNKREIVMFVGFFCLLAVFWLIGNQHFQHANSQSVSLAKKHIGKQKKATEASSEKKQSQSGNEEKVNQEADDETASKEHAALLSAAEEATQKLFDGGQVSPSFTLEQYKQAASAIKNLPDGEQKQAYQAQLKQVQTVLDNMGVSYEK